MTVLELNFFVALGTIALQIGAVFLLGVYLFRKNPAVLPFADLAGKWGLAIGFLLTLASVVMSLVYSEIYGVIPCGLCWLQRIFIYSQAVVFGVALCLKDMRAAWYSVWLSVIGAVIALYHHYIQISDSGTLPCPASGGDCGKRFIYEFDYITFPLVAFSAFAFLIILMLLVVDRERRLK
jgi:disulfide bond formation protein DsbB